MRERRFRAIITETMHFFYGSSLLNDTLYKGEIGISDNHIGHFEMCKKETLGDFTGLTDWHDNDVYEGDIIECSEGMIYTIVYNVIGFSASYKAPHATFFYDIPEQYIVIGNIHQNPELLK